MTQPKLRVKICGMTRREDILQASSLGADAIGFVCYEKSPRFVGLEKARQLLTELPPFLAVVAVLVNPDKGFVQDLLQALPVTMLQFHGEESAAFCEQFHKPYIKAVPALTGEQIEKAAREYASASALLLDTPSSDQKGGTGRCFDWSIIPEQLQKPYILAGGIDETNLSQALASSKPYAVDLSSGVESSPGVKDLDKMTRFFKAVTNEYKKTS